MRTKYAAYIVNRSYSDTIIAINSLRNNKASLSPFHVYALDTTQDDDVLVIQTIDDQSHQVSIYVTGNSENFKIKVQYLEDRKAMFVKRGFFAFGLVSLAISAYEAFWGSGDFDISSLFSQSPRSVLVWFVTGILLLLASYKQMEAPAYPSETSRAIEELLLRPLNAVEVPWAPELKERYGFVDSGVEKS